MTVANTNVRMQIGEQRIGLRRNVKACVTYLIQEQGVWQQEWAEFGFMPAQIL